MRDVRRALGEVVPELRRACPRRSDLLPMRPALCRCRGIRTMTPDDSERKRAVEIGKEGNIASWTEVAGIV